MSEQQQIDKLLGVFAELKAKAGDDSAGAGVSASSSARASASARARANSSTSVRKLELPKLERLVARLVEFCGCPGGSGCPGCEEYVVKLTTLLQGLTERFDQLERSDYKALSSSTQEITNHLVKKHQLIPEGYYTGTYIALGLSLGLIFGMVIFDNLALGLPIGLSLGVAIGAGLDGDAKKKGRVI